MLLFKTINMECKEGHSKTKCHHLHNVQSRSHNCVHFAHRIIVGRANDDTYVGFPFIKFPGEPNILNYVNDSLGNRNPKV